MEAIIEPGGGLEPEPRHYDMPLLWRLDSAFGAANDWVECDIECEEGDEYDEPIQHEDGCGCNALVSVPKYEAASEKFSKVYGLVIEHIESIRHRVQELDIERGRVYSKDETIRADYGLILAHCDRMLGPDSYTVEREDNE